MSLDRRPILPEGTSVKFREYPREGIGRVRKGHVVRVLLPGTKQVPDVTPTYVVFDQRSAGIRYLKRSDFEVAPTGS